LKYHPLQSPLKLEMLYSPERDRPNQLVECSAIKQLWLFD
jgi:hypothetical protein